MFWLRMRADDWRDCLQVEARSQPRYLGTSSAEIVDSHGFGSGWFM